ncbi:MAG: glycosyltransferase family 4 protein [Candidatus Obscuribacterales bacterium]|jgi:glycosyltransferase involved in cell wall biosynthesis|nr:glycosyltransferase family 4 protein [Candidatus Obscuribacterales bacterium]
MKILLVHNRYHVLGGEDTVVRQERALLESHGHEVVYFEEDNRKIDRMNMLDVAGKSLWNFEACNRIQEIIEHENIDVMHVHNYFPLLSPAIFKAAKQKAVGVVHTLHNFRVSCINGYFLRAGKVCEDCLLANSTLPGIINRCYRSSLPASLVAGVSLGVHQYLQTISRHVDRFIALNEQAKEKFVQAGLSSEKIIVKPNSLFPEPVAGKGDGNYAVFVGRLFPEKGIDILLAAWSKLQNNIPLKIAGEGVMADAVREAAQKNNAIEYLGWLEERQVDVLVGSARLLLFPSIWYENSPLALIEALAKGTPVVASKIGAAEQMIGDQCGVLFSVGDADEMSARVENLFFNQYSLAKMRINARKKYETVYGAERNYKTLIDVYAQAMKQSSKD